MDSSMDVGTLGVVGCGQIGCGIARVAAAAGYTVLIARARGGGAQEGLARISQGLDRDVARGDVRADERDAILARVRGMPSLDSLAGCDLVFEAIVEDLDAKRRLLALLDRALQPGAILASTTSSLSIAALGAATSRPHRVAGAHFFHPVSQTALLEIVRAPATGDDTVATLRAVGRRLGKTTVVARDTPGFIVSALLIPYLLDAIRQLEDGAATRDDLDNALRLGCNLPLGPLALADLIGADTVLYAAEAMYAEAREPRYVAPPLLRRMVRSGLLGRKSGRGFYEY